MMRRLFDNTVISAAAFLFISALGILVVPVIVRTWGLAEFGLIALARALLPVGVLGILDFGVSEITTQVVARARVSSEWDTAGRRTSCTLLLSLLIGVATAMGFVAASPSLISLFRVQEEHAEAFRLVLYATAVANLVLFPGLVAEGVLKGFERFPLLRALDVGSALVYVLATVGAAYAGLPFETVALSLLASVALRAVIVGALAYRLGKRHALSPKLPLDAEMIRDTLRWASTMAQSKLIGTVQAPLLPVIVGVLCGPRAVGVFDILVRLPRFCKSILSILNTSVLPVSARIDEQGAAAQMRRLGQAGLVILPALTVPPLAWAAVYSEPILRLWIGSSVADYWPWMSLAFAVPMAAQYLSFGQVVMLVRQSMLALLNRIAMLQILLLGIIALLAFQSLEERAFILGQALSCILVLPLQLWNIGRELGVRRLLIARVLLIQLALMAPVGAAMLLLSVSTKVNNLWELGLSLAIWCGVLWTLEYVLLLNSSSREEVRRMTLATLGRASQQGIRH